MKAGKEKVIKRRKIKKRSAEENDDPLNILSSSFSSTPRKPRVTKKKSVPTISRQKVKLLIGKEPGRSNLHRPSPKRRAHKRSSETAEKELLTPEPKKKKPVSQETPVIENAPDTSWNADDEKSPLFNKRPKSGTRLLDSGHRLRTMGAPASPVQEAIKESDIKVALQQPLESAAEQINGPEKETENEHNDAVQPIGAAAEPIESRSVTPESSSNQEHVESSKNDGGSQQSYYEQLTQFKESFQKETRSMDEPISDRPDLTEELTAGKSEKEPVTDNPDSTDKESVSEKDPVAENPVSAENKPEPNEIEHDSVNINENPSSPVPPVTIDPECLIYSAESFEKIEVVDIWKTYESNEKVESSLDDDDVYDTEKLNEDKDTKLVEKNLLFTKKDLELNEKDLELNEKNLELKEKDIELKTKDTQLTEKDTEFIEKESELITEKETELTIEKRTETALEKGTSILDKEKGISDKEIGISDSHTTRELPTDQSIEDETQNLETSMVVNPNVSVFDHKELTIIENKQETEDVIMKDEKLESFEQSQKTAADILPDAFADEENMNEGDAGGDGRTGNDGFKENVDNSTKLTITEAVKVNIKVASHENPQSRDIDMEVEETVETNAEVQKLAPQPSQNQDLDKQTPEATIRELQSTVDQEVEKNDFKKIDLEPTLEQTTPRVSASDGDNIGSSMLQFIQQFPEKSPKNSSGNSSYHSLHSSPQNSNQQSPQRKLLESPEILRNTLQKDTAPPSGSSSTSEDSIQVVTRGNLPESSKRSTEPASLASSAPIIYDLEDSDEDFEAISQQVDIKVEESENLKLIEENPSEALNPEKPEDPMTHKNADSSETLKATDRVNSVAEKFEDTQSDHRSKTEPSQNEDEKPTVNPPGLEMSVASQNVGEKVLVPGEKPASKAGSQKDLKDDDADTSMPENKQPIEPDTQRPLEKEDEEDLDVPMKELILSDAQEVSDPNQSYHPQTFSENVEKATKDTEKPTEAHTPGNQESPKATNSSALKPVEGNNFDNQNEGGENKSNSETNGAKTTNEKDNLEAGEPPRTPRKSPSGSDTLVPFDIPNLPPSSAKFSVLEILTPLSSPLSGKTGAARKLEQVSMEPVISESPESALNVGDTLFKDKGIFFRRKTTRPPPLISGTKASDNDADRIPWHSSWGKKVGKTYPPRLAQSLSSYQRDGEILEVRFNKKGEVRAAVNMLIWANRELGAAFDWLTEIYGVNLERFGLHASVEAERKGKVFVHVFEGQVIGIVSYERLELGSNVKLMDTETQEIVTLKKASSLAAKLPKVVYGISRIFVPEQWRGNHVALTLLHSTLGHLVYRMRLNKYQVSWSQMSQAGLGLAKSFNVIVDKRSGRRFLRVYTEGS